MKNLPFSILIVFLFAIGCNSGGDTSKTDEPAEQTKPPVQENAMPEQTTNPPHGEPGHVHNEGAPADASTGTGAAPSGDVKLNPPHGEPGHRCDIAVGAPLPQ